jgi:hypothetical protein
MKQNGTLSKYVLSAIALAADHGGVPSRGIEYWPVYSPDACDASEIRRRNSFTIPLVLRTVVGMARPTAVAPLLIMIQKSGR